MKFEDMSQSEKDKCVNTYLRACIDWQKKTATAYEKYFLNEMEKVLKDALNERS